MGYFKELEYFFHFVNVRGVPKSDLKIDKNSDDFCGAFGVAVGVE